MLRTRRNDYPSHQGPVTFLMVRHHSLNVCLGDTDSNLRNISSSEIECLCLLALFASSPSRRDLRRANQQANL